MALAPRGLQEQVGDTAVAGMGLSLHFPARHLGRLLTLFNL